MTLNQIFENDILSVRAYNVCGGNNLYNLDLILDYYSKKFTFKKLRNCGDRTNRELIEFCKNHLGEISETKSTKQKSVSFLELTSTLSRKQREVINSFILMNTSSLSIRSQNAVKRHLQNNLKIKNFSRKIFDSNLDVRNMKNVGKRSIPEIEMYINIIGEYFNEILSIEDENQLTVLRNQFLIRKTFSFKHVPNEILESESIFLLANFLLERNAFFNKKETLIFKKSIQIYDEANEVLLDDVGKLVDLSRERVRQIRKRCLDDLFTKFNFLKNFNDNLYSNYGIEENSTFVFVDDTLRSRVNKINETNFSSDFITYILYVYQSDLYALIGNIEDVLQANFFNHRDRHNWKSFYLVNKKISEEFSFDLFFEDVNSRIEDRITETYTFNFKSYLSKFLVANRIELLEDIIPIAEKMVFEELNIIIDLEDNIAFKRTTSKVAYEYAFEALEHLGRPSKVKKIASKVTELHPHYDTDEVRIRACMKRMYGFVPVGRKSVYALKKWEDELDNFKGGTIRRISEEYLLSVDRPKHVNEITEYVKQFRPTTNEKSIFYNLKVDESKTFSFYENMHIGLCVKTYSDQYKIVDEKTKPQKKTWEENFEILIQFINNNNRLPFSSGCPEAEEKLYRWFSVQKGKIKKGKLNQEQKTVIKAVLDKFEVSIGKRSSNNKQRMEELLKFVEQNFRLPSANKEGEKNLYAFHYKLRKKFKADELSEDEKKKLIEVALLLQKQNI
jgi:hypothetical protein